MDKVRIFRSPWLLAGLEVLVWEAVIVLLAWLASQNMFKHLSFSDVLFMFGALQLLASGGGMMRTPAGATGAAGVGARVPGFHLQTNEQEERYQAVAELVQKNAFSIKMGIGGLLTILLSVVA